MAARQTRSRRVLLARIGSGKMKNDSFLRPRYRPGRLEPYNGS
jgi:hypothetical protein